MSIETSSDLRKTSMRKTVKRFLGVGDEIREQAVSSELFVDPRADLVEVRMISVS